MNRARILALLLACLALAVFAAGCGDDDDSGGDDLVGGAGRGRHDDHRGQRLEPRPPARSRSRCRTSQFDPKDVTVKVGQKVMWVNEDTVDHDVTATEGADFKSDTFGKDGTFEYTTEEAGTIKYVCTLHPGMKGTITVRVRAAQRPRRPKPRSSEQRALAERAVLGQHAELDRGVVEVEEGAHAPQPLARRVELAVEDGVHDDERGRWRGSSSSSPRCVPTSLHGRGDEAPVGQPLAGALEARVGKRLPQPRGVARRAPAGPRAARRRAGPRSARRARSTARNARRSRPDHAASNASISVVGAHDRGPRMPSSGARPRRSVRRGMRPAPRASRPASTRGADRARHRDGSCAREIALAHSTRVAAELHRQRRVADAVPTPASRITGTVACSTISAMLYGLRMPIPLPIGEPSGMTAAQPTSSRRRARTGSSFV